IDQALLGGTIDLAVHSLKDVETHLPDGLNICCVLEREDARDVFISPFKKIDLLPDGGRFGTASLRRKAQILSKRPDLDVTLFRGNVQTRIGKIKDGLVDGTMLALAGLKRLGIAQRTLDNIGGCILSHQEMLPAVGQGALAIVMADKIAKDKKYLKEAVFKMQHWPSFLCVSAERAMLSELNGSCRTPIAGYAFIDKNILSLRGLLADEISFKICSHALEVELGQDLDKNLTKAKDLGIQLGKHLKQQQCLKSS
ncbi:MAG: hydroxymethylbilane synthase, partial [Pseudomonadota bacterium]